MRRYIPTDRHFLVSVPSANRDTTVTAEVLVLQIQAAQGADKADKIAEEQKKLTKNISLDVAAAGQASTAVSFDG